MTDADLDALARGLRSKIKTLLDHGQRTDAGSIQDALFAITSLRAQVQRLHTLAKANNDLARMHADTIKGLRNQLTASEARERELRAELAQRPQWAGGQSPITCGPSGSLKVAPRLHTYEADPTYPWFCKHCGYPPHEPLKHPKGEGTNTENNQS